MGYPTRSIGIAVCSYFYATPSKAYYCHRPAKLFTPRLASITITLLLLANKERSSSERPMEGGIADETSMPPLKCERFDSAA